MSKAGILIAALGLAVGLAGCSAGDGLDDPFADYGRRTMTVSPGAGNAMAANTAIQVINPTPAYAYNTHIPGNGSRAVRAIRCYEGEQVGGGAPQTSAQGGANVSVNIGSGVGATSNSSPSCPPGS